MNTNESNVEMATRFFWSHSKQCVDQLHLIADPSKPWRGGRNAFVDLFVGLFFLYGKQNNKIPAPSRALSITSSP